MSDTARLRTQSPPPETARDDFSRMFFWAVPFTIPIIVAMLTSLFYAVCSPRMIWLPLIFIYWITIWAYALAYRAKRGGVFSRERFKPTLKLRGSYRGLQYLLIYGPLALAIPSFIARYAARLSPAMCGAILLASVINGFSEEIYWRGCLDDAGKNAGVSEKKRLAFAPAAFALWHTAFVIHLYPWNRSWWAAWAAIVAMTWLSGFVWLWVMHRSGRLIPQCLYHASANFLSIFPMLLLDVLHCSF